MQSLVSVIVPVYKAEGYLDKCVNSILFQTYKNLEIILVDDGSPDRCPQICDDFALRDSRVKVFHKANGGVSSARNVGLENATGEYICFVDSDDTMPDNGIMDLCKGVSDNNCQYVAGICSIDKSNKVKNQIKFDKLIDFNKSPSELLDYITKSGSYSPYAKIFKADIIKKYGIRYNESLKCSEDALFIRQYLIHCSRIFLISKVVYKYNISNNDSLSKKGYPDFCLYYVEKLKALKELVSVLPMTDDEQKSFISDRAVHGLYISIQHYLSNWNDETEVKELIIKTLLSLKVWIRVDKDPVTISTVVSKWWKKYNKLIDENKIDELYKRLRREHRKASYFLRFKQIGKQFLLKLK